MPRYAFMQRALQVLFYAWKDTSYCASEVSFMAKVEAERRPDFAEFEGEGNAGPGRKDYLFPKESNAVEDLRALEIG